MRLSEAVASPGETSLVTILGVLVADVCWVLDAFMMIVLEPGRPVCEVLTPRGTVINWIFLLPAVPGSVMILVPVFVPEALPWVCNNCCCSWEKAPVEEDACELVVGTLMVIFGDGGVDSLRTDVPVICVWMFLSTGTSTIFPSLITS